MTAKRLDPKPWVSWGIRYATAVSPSCYFEPGDEFEQDIEKYNAPARELDPEPWFRDIGDGREQRWSWKKGNKQASNHVKFSPRPQYEQAYDNYYTAHQEGFLG